MKDLVVVNSMEALVEPFVDAGVEVTFVQAFKSSISSMKALVDALVEVSVDVDSVKPSKTSVKTFITSMKAPMESSVGVIPMEAFVEAFMDAGVEVTFVPALIIFHIFYGSFGGRSSGSFCGR